MVLVIKKKLCLCLIIIIYCLILIGCEKNYYNEVWHLDTEEKSIIFLPKYKEYTLNIIDEYNIEYKLSEIQDSNYIKLLFIFENRDELTIIFRNREYQYGNLSITLDCFGNESDFFRNINNQYYEIIYKIGYFCAFDFRGNKDTFENLMLKCISENTKGDAYYYHYDSLYNNIGYWFYYGEVKDYAENSKDIPWKWYASYQFNSLLSDKNIY